MTSSEQRKREVREPLKAWNEKFSYIDFRTPTSEGRVNTGVALAALDDLDRALELLGKVLKKAEASLHPAQSAPAINAEIREFLEATK